MPAPDAYDRADHLLEVGRAQAALELLTQAGEPEDGRGLRLFWLANQRLGRQDEALRWADRAVSVEPLAANSWVYRGTALLELGRTEDAITAARRAVELGPESFASHYLLGRALIRNSAEPAELLAVTTTAVRLAPDNAEAHVLLGLAHDEAGDSEAAAAAYRAALAIDPDNAGARNNLARTDLWAHRRKKAVGGFRSALASDPQNTTMHENLGRAVFMWLYRHTLALHMVLLMLVIVVVNIVPPYWIRGVLALVIIGGWSWLWWRRVGGLDPAVRRQLFAQVRDWWGLGVIRGIMIGLALQAVCALVAALVPGGRLGPDLVLGFGVVVSVVVMAVSYRRGQRTGSPLPADPAKP
ncbi:MAG TPA: tetratricopeptide repeat protein [Pseudonocardiaceae bacterium]|nr:tetratricopeptide repeat protein [Pseudonocardiaceae bacterium]